MNGGIVFLTCITIFVLGIAAGHNGASKQCDRLIEKYAETCCEWKKNANSN